MLPLLPLFYRIFTFVDPDSYWEYGSGFTKLLNMDPIRARIHNPNLTTAAREQIFLKPLKSEKILL